MTKKIKLKISARLLKKRLKRQGQKTKKQCRFCNMPDLVKEINYKNSDFLQKFLTERGKILPSRISGNSTKYQRYVAREIKKARNMALLPYCATDY